MATTIRRAKPAASADGATSRWRSGRLVSFYCFILSGILLDIYFNWYSFHFDAECSDSGNGVPPSFVIFTAMSAIPAAASILFGRELLYKILCLGIWIVYCGLIGFLIVESRSIEGQIGVNCYRDVGGVHVVSFAFTALFAAAIIALTVAACMVVLARRFLFSNRGP
jgi:hypothetical protein